MPRSCSVCQSAQTSSISKDLMAGASLRDIANRYKVGAASVGRHLTNCLKQRRREQVAPQEARKARQHKAASSPSPVSRLDDRCSKCGLSMTASDAEMLLKRTERLLWLAETIAAQAHQNQDSRLALQAVDRARAALETMMRATGLIGGDAQVNLTIDARKQSLHLMSQLSIEELRNLARLANAPVV